MNRTLIFMGIEFVHPNNINDLEENYPDLICQRLEIESKSNWPTKDKSATYISNRHTMIRKTCNEKRVLHVHIPLYCFDYNNMANILLKVSKNKEKLGSLFSVYPTHCLNDIKFETIISEISLNEGLDTSILH
jgi:hypothetical protein